jgi:hypothetical protein
LSVLALVLAGCATPPAKPDLGRPDFSQFSAQSVVEADIVRRYGEPDSRGQVLKHGQLVHSLTYVRLTGDWSDRVRYRKRCLFFFVGQKYLGYSFLSGAPEDQVRFDETQVPKVIKGKTTKDEVSFAAREWWHRVARRISAAIFTDDM